MQKRVRREYTAQTKADAVGQVLKAGLPRDQVARTFEMPQQTLDKWIKKAKDGTLVVPAGVNVRPSASEQDELIAKLKAQVAQLSMERDILKKATAYFAKAALRKYAWIEQHRPEFPVNAMCRVLSVSKSGYYARALRAKSPQAQQREQNEQKLHTAIQEQSQRHKQRYGRPRMTDQLKKLGFVVNHKRVGKAMKELDLQCKLRRKYKICTTDSKHDYAIANNLLNRQFTQGEPNKAWVTDITYIHTGEGWLFAALVMDLF